MNGFCISLIWRAACAVHHFSHGCGLACAVMFWSIVASYVASYVVCVRHCFRAQCLQLHERHIMFVMCCVWWCVTTHFAIVHVLTVSPHCKWHSTLQHALLWSEPVQSRTWNNCWCVWWCMCAVMWFVHWYWVCGNCATYWHCYTHSMKPNWFWCVRTHIEFITNYNVTNK